MKYIFFDADENTCSIENIEQMKSYIVSGELNGKTQIYDYDNDVLTKASQISDFSKLNNRIKSESGGIIQTGYGSSGVTYNKSLSADEKFIINNKTFTQKKKSIKGCLIGLVFLIFVIPGIISVIIDEFSGNTEEQTTSYIPTENEVNRDFILNNSLLLDSLKAYEQDYNSDYDSLINTYANYDIKNFLSVSLVFSVDSLKMYKIKTVEIKKVINSLRSEENNRFMKFLTLVNNMASGDSLNINELPRYIQKAQDGNRIALEFYDLEIQVMDKYIEIYNFFLSIQGKFKYESEQIIFDRTEDLDRYNSLIQNINDFAGNEEEWIKRKNESGIFNLKGSEPI
jgi:hypothetical protein